MTDRDIMQQALEALELLSKAQTETALDYADNAIERLRSRLAQPEQEPVANIRIWHKNEEQHAELWNWDKGIETLPDGYYDLYTTPPQRTWVGLTDEEISDLWCKVSNTDFVTADTHVFARAIEAKLKENT